MQDNRNVTDEFKGMPQEEIVQALDERGVKLEIAIENLERDYNMGTIVRSANAFGVRKVHVIGRKQWNKRGAMMTDKYLHVLYYATVDEFVTEMRKQDNEIIAIENNVESYALCKTKLPENCVFVFGSEGNGISDELLKKAGKVIHIEQLGSTRSVNVGVAAGIAMYAWLQQHTLTK
ncbi:TrmH family RNA methyltransferase [Candidatus Saccharibacteria bacterium]|nr:TrmH family RNA methyltransferase [Candidatus Saccharibacteria bacterium]